MNDRTSSCLVVALLFVAMPACNRREQAEREELRAELVKGAKELERRTLDRKVRGTTIPGSFGEGFERAKDERVVIERAQEASNTCLTALLGTDEAKKASCDAALAPSRDALATLLRLTASERGGPPAGLHPLAPTSAGSGFNRQFTATCTRAAAEVVWLVHARRPNEAAAVCGQAAQAARDWSMGATLVGGAVALSCFDKLDLPCRRAIDAADDPVRTTLSQDLDDVVRTIPPFTDYADAEAYGVHLHLCGTFLEPADRAMLGPLARAAADESDKQGIPESERKMHWTLCRDGLRAALLRCKAFRESADSGARERMLREGQSTLEAAKVTGVDFAPLEAKFDKAVAAVRFLAARAGAPNETKMVRDAGQ